jgi:hypothetical protein
MYVKETVTSCRMDWFVLEHGPVTGSCEVGNEHGLMLFYEFPIDHVTVRLSLNLILGVKIYTLDREDRVS